ncbi:hypothetical protein M885DRAFT_563099 [Pelagophyceae sp. CCMP2097]|nr:hypothetical protein M885DRAFT_563099 [Pelagophyceae sp. CCMP2097]
MRAQARAGGLLWAIAAATLLAYSYSPPFEKIFNIVAIYNERHATLFAFCSFSVCGGMVPSLVLLLQRRRAKRSSQQAPSLLRQSSRAPSLLRLSKRRSGANSRGDADGGDADGGDASMDGGESSTFADASTSSDTLDVLFNTVVFGLYGIWVGVFYNWQVVWFGEGQGPKTVATKVALDMFVFVPILDVPYLQLLFKYRNCRFPTPLKFFRLLVEEGSFTARGVLAEWWFPALFPTWLVWIPCASAVYAFPAGLQLPMNVLVTIFWGLIMQLSGLSEEPATTHIELVPRPPQAPEDELLGDGELI